MGHAEVDFISTIGGIFHDYEFWWIPSWLLAIVELTPITLERWGRPLGLAIWHAWMTIGLAKRVSKDSSWTKWVNFGGWSMCFFRAASGPKYFRCFLSSSTSLIWLVRISRILVIQRVPTEGMSLHFDLAVVALCRAGASVSWPCWWVWELIVEGLLESTFHICDKWQDDRFGTSPNRQDTTKLKGRRAVIYHHLSLPFLILQHLRASKPRGSDWEDSQPLGLGF